MHQRPIHFTGATGYIGSRLLRELEARGYAVRCLARQPAGVKTSRATTEVVTGDCLDAASLDREAAANFGRAARRAGVRRIIHLGGLADNADALSTHVKTRVETGGALRDSGVPSTLPNCPHAVGEIPHRTIADPTAAMTDCIARGDQYGMFRGIRAKHAPTARHCCRGAALAGLPQDSRFPYARAAGDPDAD